MSLKNLESYHKYKNPAEWRGGVTGGLDMADFQEFIQSKTPEEWSEYLYESLTPNLIFIENATAETFAEVLRQVYQKSVTDAGKITFRVLQAYHEWNQ